MWTRIRAYHAGYAAGGATPRKTINDAYHHARRYQAQAGAELGTCDSFDEGYRDAEAGRRSKY